MSDTACRAEPAISDTDRALIEDLFALEGAMGRNYEWVFDLIKPYLGQSVLEVGSGVGVISKFLVDRGTPVVLSDYHPVYLEHLRGRFGDRAQVQIRLLDLTSDSDDTGALGIDTIVCLNVLEHLPDDHAVLARCARMLPARGRLILQVPNYPALFGSLDEVYGHQRRYTRTSLEEKLTRAGFNVIAMRYFNPFAIPGWILSAKILRAQRLSPASARLFNAAVPLLRRLDFFSRFGGLALIACAERP
jgi:2-polyprenyl-3-methyl-5-hydroxy-6-metoxy-1,4-benzoquinol methylase